MAEQDDSNTIIRRGTSPDLRWQQMTHNRIQSTQVGFCWTTFRDDGNIANLDQAG